MNSDNEATYGPVVRAAFIRVMLPGEWGMAIARQESAFDPNATTMSGGDGARGGSYGLCQMSLATARNLGFQGDAKTLLDPWVNALYAAALCRQNVAIVGNDLSRVAAAYNCGAKHVLENTIPQSTATQYVPNVLRFAAEYAAQFASEDVSKEST